MNEISPARDSTAVSAEAVIEVRLTDPAPLPLLVGLSCTSENPGAISVSFCDGDDESRVWTCAREFLAEGLAVPAEDGDMMLWREGEDTLVVVQRLPDPVRLEYPGGRIRFEFPAGEVRAFLDQAYAFVPAGTVPASPDNDEFILTTCPSGRRDPTGEGHRRYPAPHWTCEPAYPAGAAPVAPPTASERSTTC